MKENDLWKERGWRLEESLESVLSLVMLILLMFLPRKRGKAHHRNLIPFLLKDRFSPLIRRDGAGGDGSGEKVHFTSLTT